MTTFPIFSYNGQNLGSNGKLLVVPGIPPIDKYVAALRSIYDILGNTPGTEFYVEFCRQNVVPQERLDSWRDLGAVTIDVGPGKYHGKHDSAASAEYSRSLTKTVARWNYLLPLIAVNNKSGFLKELPCALARLVREVPHLPGVGQFETFTRGLDALRSINLPQDRRKWEDLEKDEFTELKQAWGQFDVQFDFEQDLAIPENQKKFFLESCKKYSVHPEESRRSLSAFTIPGYLKRMFLAGWPVSAILERVTWWYNNEQEVKNLTEQGRKKEFTYSPFRFGDWSLGERRLRGGVALVKDYFDSKGFMFQNLGRSTRLALAIIRMPSKGVLIATSKHYRLNFEPFVRTLQAMEPGLWYFESRYSNGGIQMAMNGSWQYTQVPNTGLTENDLVGLVIQHVGYSAPSVSEITAATA